VNFGWLLCLDKMATHHDKANQQQNNRHVPIFTAVRYTLSRKFLLRRYC
jgi:hypothetical protein